MPPLNRTNIQLSISNTATVFERLNLLIVDGNRHMRTLLKGVLRAFGIRSFREADGGAAAMTVLRIAPVDVIITEYSLDSMTGIELSRWVRTAAESPNPMVPIIMLSGYTEHHIVTGARDVGVNEFLVKPISADALYARIVGTVYSPRPFVTMKSYRGPDRRRKSPANLETVERRTVNPETVMPQPLQHAENLIKYFGP
ncbi:MAG: response regulator [Alphaproteobacteria bacterium]|nr:response regulator [Alphaproteobacteria bacterium]